MKSQLLYLCMRASRFVLGDGSGSVTLVMHRTGAGTDRGFDVRKDIGRMAGTVKRFRGSGCKAEAKRYYNGELARLTVTGMRREDPTIAGFHEEG